MFKFFSFLNKGTFFFLNRRFSTKAFRPMFENFFKSSNNIAVIDNLGPHRYKDILSSSFSLAKQIDKIIQSSLETNNRISFLCSNDSSYVSVLLACWISGNVAVPLCSNHPDTLLEYFIKNSQSCLLITNDSFSDTIQNIALKLNINYFNIGSKLKDSAESFKTIEQSKFSPWDINDTEKEALIIYTSGSTGLPKGVVLTHGNLHSQVSSLVKAWEITSEDTILHTLPLHHMHGIMNALLCLLHVGGSVVMRPRFIATEVWNYLTNQNYTLPRVNLFYGVPTMYVKLIDELKNLSDDKCHIRKCCEENIRLMTSGSAALPDSVFYKWKDLTGHSLLERFGMSEIGMALSNPLKGPRIPGSVGNPLPEVDVKIVEDSSDESSVLVEGNDSHIKVWPNSEEKAGELLIRGPNVFKEYWNNEKATIEAFSKLGWFKTGDTASFSNGSFRILGRTSVDIIKCGGYKISSLEVESCLLLHSNISDCAVFGVPDEIWGEIIVALVVIKDKEITDADIKIWCKKFLPSYSVPSVIKYVNVIPRNVMGKMNKKELKNSFP